MKTAVLAGTIMATMAGAAQADLYSVGGTINVDGQYIFDDNQLAPSDGGVQAGYTLGLHSESHDLYLQMDGSADLWGVQSETFNGSFILTHVGDTAKYGGFAGLLSKSGYDLLGNVGLIGMAELGGGYLESEVGVLTSIEDGAFFDQTTWFAAGKYSYPLSDTLGAFGHVAYMGHDDFYYLRGLLGLERTLPDQSLIFNFGAGAISYNGLVYPAARAEIRYRFDGTAGTNPSAIAARLFDKFDPEEFLYYRSGRILQPYQ